MANINFNFPYVADPDKGTPLAFCQLFVGIPDLDPEIPANQKQLSIIQEDGTLVAVLQPLVFSAGGVPTYNGSTVRLDVDGNYSFKILDKNNELKYYVHNVFEGEPITGIELINDLSQAYEFPTVAAYKASSTDFPDDKIIHLLDRGATFKKISGTGTANTFNIIQSDQVSASLVYQPKGNSINSKAWGLVGGVDETIGLQTFLQSMIDNDYEAIISPLTFITTSILINETSERNFNLHCPIGRAVIQVDSVIDRLINMTEAFSARCINVDFDLNENCPNALTFKTTNTKARDAIVKGTKITGCQQTTQAVNARAIEVGGPYDNININEFEITSCERDNPALFCQAITVSGITGICVISDGSISNVSSPVGSFDCDAIAVFGAKNLVDTELDDGKVTIDNVNFKDSKGRFIKSQHSSTTVTNCKGELSSGYNTIENWRYADFQMSNGDFYSNRLNVGTLVIAEGGGSFSPAFAKFVNNKDTTPTKVSNFHDNVLTSKTAFAQVVTVGAINGFTSINIHDNDIGLHTKLVLNEATNGAFTELYYKISDNTLESKGQIFANTVDQSFNQMFVEISDNSNIDTDLGHFRQTFPNGGVFSLGHNFVVRNNKGFVDKVDWVFLYDRLHDGNSFVTDGQSNTTQPFVGVQHVQMDGLTQAVIPDTGLARYQRTMLSPSASTWNAWRSVTYT